MGGKPSKTRKLTIENEGPTSVIKISDGLAQRLKGNQTQEEVRRHDQVKSPALWPSTHEGVTVGGPLPFIHEPSLTSLQIRQANIAELKKNDEYWEKRIKELQSCHKKMQEIMDQEYSKAVGEIRGINKHDDGKEVIKYKLPPCVDNKQAVMECYKMYPNEPMRCAKEVQAFAECVDMKRATIVASRG